jgi:hypothetical protein
MAKIQLWKVRWIMRPLQKRITTELLGSKRAVKTLGTDHSPQMMFLYAIFNG